MIGTIGCRGKFVGYRVAVFTRVLGVSFHNPIFVIMILYEIPFLFKLLVLAVKEEGKNKNDDVMMRL